jgi:signal transduction histidine kinase
MVWTPAVAAALAAAGLVEMLLAGVASATVVTCGVVAAVLLGLRPWRPLAAPVASLLVFAVPVVAVARQVPLLGQKPNSLALTLAWLMAVFFAGAQRTLTRAGIGLAVVTIVCMLYAAGPGSPTGSATNDILASGLFSGAVPWLAGVAVAWQRRARATERALQQANVAAAVERSRIAREVHDLVAHTVSVMVVQAEAAEALMPTSPERSAESLHAVQEAGRQALSEMRRTVAALRAGDVTAAGHGLDDLPALLATVRAAGVPVSVVTDGTPAPLDPRVDRSAYRIVQEGLTNVLRHSDRTGATVRIGYTSGTLTVSVVDEGHPVRRRLAGGHGLAGIRERVTALGGTFDAGPTDDGRHLIHAQLPRALAT